MVGLVIVSHSAALAEGVVALAREMGGEEVAIEAAGGMEDGAIGTDAARVLAAIEAARSSDGVLVLMDLGSALMSAEMAVEMADPDGGPIRLSAAPLAEGAVAAAARARGGAGLDEVAAEARDALASKAGQLDDDEEPEAPSPSAEPGGEALRFTVSNRLGLHARPAARFVGALAGLDADVRVSNLTRERGPGDGRSLTGLALLTVRSGDEVEVRATGPDADRALTALRELAEAGFGEADADAPPAADPTPGGDAAPGGDTASEPDTASDPDTASAPAAGAVLPGVAAAPGIAVGPLRPLVAAEPAVAEAAEGPAEEELARLEAAREAVREELAEVRADVAERAGAEDAAIFAVHAALLDDAALLEPARAAIAGGASAGAAWRDAAREVVAAYRGLDDAYLRERAADVQDVGRRVLARLAPAAPDTAEAEPGVLAAAELTPGQTAGLDPAVTHGIATARGGVTGHAAILARALGIPAVTGLGKALLAVPAGTDVILDGAEGTLTVAPGPEALQRAAERRDADAAGRAAALERAAEPGALADGRRVEVFANVGGAAEIAAAVEQGAEGVGLLRTEFLFLDRSEPPTEDEQADALRAIARALGGRPLVVRTLDAGADKPLPFLRQAEEDNPFLGRRGLRLSLAEPELFRTQLRAILRVAAEHELKLMFPMVTTLAELREARALLEAERSALEEAPELEVGVMVEVPALALAADRFAPEVDFLSIGTNDLTQYTMAAERGNAELAPLLDGIQPAVLGLIATVCAAAREHGRWVGVCGELAGDPLAAAILAGLGVGELSMSAGRIPAVKAALRETTGKEAEALAARALQAEDAAAVRALRAS